MSDWVGGLLILVSTATFLGVAMIAEKLTKIIQLLVTIRDDITTRRP